MPGQYGPKNSTCYQDRVWMPHQSEAWVPAKITNHLGDQVTLEVPNGESIVMPEKDVAQLDRVHSEQLEGVDDVITMSHVTEGALLHTVRERYTNKLMYTRVARTLIAVNPFRPLPIYSQQHLQKYASCNNSLELAPHIFGVGQDAIQGLRTTDFDQAVLISGESGAGKTESAKLIMSYVASAMRSNRSDLMELVLLTNPVLEAFGNAMTVRNNNSSRFGKWQDLRFSDSMESLGCTLHSYLLETTRVSGPAKDERNYHVFYQLLGARSDPDLAGLNLEGPEAYRYLKSCKGMAPGIDDSKNYRDMKDALTKLGVSVREQSQVFRVVAGVLTLGNSDFLPDGKGEGCNVADQAPVIRAADLLQIDSKKLTELMLVRKIKVNGEVTVAVNRTDQARAVRDALARLLYGRLFQWLIQKMNSLLVVDSSRVSDSRLLGLLDIAGFECFAINSLEQLLINLSNEHLQQQFNQHVFKMEQEECRREGVKIIDIKGFHDNADLLTFIDQKAGVLDLLDETGMTGFSTATDSTFVSKVLASKNKHPRLIVPKIATKVPQFGIKHFAGPVSYSCEGWLEKNVEKLPQETADVLFGSGLDLMCDIGGLEPGESGETGGALGPRRSMNTACLAGGRRPKSVSGVFRSSLRDLMAKINAAQPHYVRCVKPNAAKVPGKFESPAVMEQLLFSGVFATVQIRQQGYAHRIPHEEFVFLYSCVVQRFGQPIWGVRSWSNNAQERMAAKAKAIVEALPGALASLGYETDQDTFAVGLTKIFARFAVQQALDDARRQALHKIATQLQCVFRGFIARKNTAVKHGVEHACTSVEAIGAGTKIELAKKMAEERAYMEQEFAAKLAEERARMEQDFAAKLASEQAQAQAEVDKARIVAETAKKAEKDIETRLVTERAATEKQFATRLDEVTAEFARNRAAMQEEAANIRAAEQAKVREVEKLAAQKAAAHVAVAQQLEKERGDHATKLQSERNLARLELERRLAAERAAAEEELGQRLSAERANAQQVLERRLGEERADAEQKLAHRLSAEHKKAETELAERLVAEHQAAEEKLREDMRMEKTALEDALKQKISSEEVRAEAAERLAEQGREAQEALTQRFQAERAAAQKRLKEQLKAERDSAEKQLVSRLSLERVAAEREVSRKLLEEHAMAEQQLSRSLNETHRAAKDALEQKLVGEQARADAAEKLAAKRLEAAQESAQRLRIAQAQAKDELERKILQQRTEAEQCLARRLAAEHAKTERELEEKLVAEHRSQEAQLKKVMEMDRAALEDALRQKVSFERARAEIAERLAAQSQEAKTQFAHRLAAERVAAQTELMQRLKAERDAANEQLAARRSLERSMIEREVSRDMLVKHALAEQQLRRTFLEQHRASKEELERKLLAERARAEEAERLVTQRLHAERSVEKIVAERLQSMKELRTSNGTPYEEVLKQLCGNPSQESLNRCRELLRLQNLTRQCTSSDEDYTKCPDFQLLSF